MSNIFRKSLPTLGVEGKLGGQDRKKIRRAVEKIYKLAEEDVEALLPNKAGEFESVKLAAPRREVIYKLDGLPILIDTSGKLDIVPTIFGLWRVPTLLPRVYLKHPAVSTYIVGGADLMLPGVHIPPEGLPAFQKNDLLAVCVHGNPAPLALGWAGMSRGDALLRKGGKLVEVVQAYGDCLWSVLGKGQVPNDGYIQGAVVPMGTGAAGLDCSGYEEGDDGQPIGTAADGSQTEPAGGQGEGIGVAEQVAGLSLGAGSATDSGQASGEKLWPEDMDELLELTLLQALHKSVTDEQLPLTSSVLWSQHMQPQRPVGVTLDVKKSKHKKLGAFLKAYGAKGGLLSLKEDKHSGDQVLTAIDRDHSLYTEYRPYRIALTAAGAGAGPGALTSTTGGSSSGKSKEVVGGSGELQVEELVRPGKELKPLFEALNMQYDALYTAAEVSDVAFAYAKAAKLEEGAPDERTLVLDITLCDALFKGLVKKGEVYPSHLPKAQLRESALRRCHPQWRISRGHEMVVRKGNNPPTVAVSVDKRQGNKKVTRIAGVEAFLVDPEALATECAKRFACSATTAELPGKGAGLEVVIQGSVLEEAAAFLVDRLKIPKKFIDIKK